MTYSEKRSSLAKSLGLGKLRAREVHVEPKPTPKALKKAVLFSSNQSLLASTGVTSAS
ncbi:hypothetical protein QO016_002869 [Methylobacterium persicinum]|uniref:Uncharacterized protein n=1 Tax=Methylobacterium persicinum TaxID=374426 RepID=A0ABU0HPC6_9HYPH|nr:hypothetical protein [Methylobacterium persicinum]GJE37643.1 hypothetical protein KHHGKMAE_1703 [Methylobacterium persicinum]